MQNSHVPARLKKLSAGHSLGPACCRDHRLEELLGDAPHGWVPPQSAIKLQAARKHRHTSHAQAPAPTSPALQHARHHAPHHAHADSPSAEIRPATSRRTIHFSPDLSEPADARSACMVPPFGGLCDCTLQSSTPPCPRQHLVSDIFKLLCKSLVRCVHHIGSAMKIGQYRCRHHLACAGMCPCLRSLSMVVMACIERCKMSQARQSWSTSMRTGLAPAPAPACLPQMCLPSDGLIAALNQSQRCAAEASISCHSVFL